MALVPPDSSFLGIRFALGVVLRTHPPTSLIDRFAPLPVSPAGQLRFVGEREIPAFDDAELLVRDLLADKLLHWDPSWVDDLGSFSDRSRQRRHLARVGLTRGAAARIEQVNRAAARIRAGHRPADVAHDLGYFDQPHLAHALKRYIGKTATEVATQSGDPLSFLPDDGE
ncbi:hypothetical protein ACFFGH_25635 [Lysobacter korlensis]|uniref:HTH araC/xylS-type domain-containing protein n=1 Tax=Lysobacter korlensis TaxID=553636 RepID=A0ABV6RWR3_9GAMM